MEENVDSGTYITGQDWYRMLLEVQILAPFIRYGLKSCQWHKDQWLIKRTYFKKEGEKEKKLYITRPSTIGQMWHKMLLLQSH